VRKMVVAEDRLCIVDVGKIVLLQRCIFWTDGLGI